jgi:hypothetical protein
MKEKEKQEKNPMYKLAAKAKGTKIIFQKK